MTAKKFPKTSHNPSEHETVRLGAPPPRRAKLPPMTGPASDKPTLGRKQSGLAVPPRNPDPEHPSRELPRLGKGGLVRRAPGLVVPPVKPHLEQPSPEPPRLGGGSPKLNEPVRLVRPQTKNKTK
jgi:hypothetical protein